MEFRQLGRSGFKVPILTFGTATFGGTGMLKAWGETNLQEASRLIDICLDRGAMMFDSANTYSDGAAEEILGAALSGRRNEALISTKVGFPKGATPNDVGSSRHFLIKAVEGSLRRLKTDHIDLLHLHAYDAITPAEEIMSTLDVLVRDGKIRYTGVSNHSGWHLMKALAVADRYGYPRHVSNQSYYSLIGRDFEWDGMPLGLDQGVGTMVWSALGWGRLTGKLGRNKPLPPVSRLHDETQAIGPQVPDEYLYTVLDALDVVARETGRSVPQIALNWLLGRPTVSTVLIGARNETQLVENLAAIEWSLSAEHSTLLDKASAIKPPYPYWHQKYIGDRNPFLANPQVGW